MNQQTSSLILAGLLLGFVAVPQASAKTAKDCIAEWRADKAGMQARGTTEKAYVDQCKDGAAPTAAAPGATPSAASPKTATGGPSQKSAKDCTAEWRADKAGMQARGTTEKAYVEQCKGGAEPTVAAPIVPKPSATTPAPTTPAPTAQKSAPPSSTPAPRQASTPKESDSKSGQFADEAQAKRAVLVIRWCGPILARRYIISVAAKLTETRNVARTCARKKR